MTETPPKFGGHIITAEDRLKKTGKRNPGMALVNSIKNRKWCGAKCRIFWYCPMMPLSMSRANVDGACLLNKGGNVLIRRFLNLMAKGEDGLLNEIMNTLFSYGYDIETAPPSVKKEYAMMCLQLHKQLYADKERAQEMKPQLTVVINEMGRDGVIREVPVIEVGKVSAAGVSKAASDFLDSLEEEDPDSLLDSPKLEEIMRHVQESNSGTADDGSEGTEGEPKELEEASSGTGGGT